MSTDPSDFDLKFLPDWLKEEPKKNAYADYEGGESERPGRDFSRPRPPRRDQGRKDSRQGGDSRPRRQDRQDDRNRPRAAQVPAAPVERTPQVNVEFLPEPNCTIALAKQIKAGARAYPLFDLARMFLEKPDRHRVKITTTDGAAKLYQCGEGGSVSLDRQSLERNAFTLSRHLFYTEETTQGEPPKGNYTNVARCSLSGTLLGPTNHHAYQPTLRKLYEERFSRRMSFPEYQRQIEVVTKPEVIEAWKEQARSVTTFKTLEETPVTIESASEAERHFRTHYLEKCLRSGNSFEISGEASRNLPDRGIANAVRQSWEDENRFPGHLMNNLRREFIHAGLYIFKHRNRVQLVSAIRPTPFSQSQQTLSDTITEILKAIGSTPKCTRVDLAAKIIPLHPEDDPAKIKSQLASDLHWLTHAGHVIEMHNGILELPGTPNPNPNPSQKKPQTKQTSQAPVRSVVAQPAQPVTVESASPVVSEPTPPAEVSPEQTAAENHKPDVQPADVQPADTTRE